MNILHSWIQELLPGLAMAPEKLAELLTAHSFETVIKRTYKIDPNIIVVRIVSVEKHPNADRLRLATVTDGKKEITVVCGAPNIEAGQIVPYSPPGTQVYDADGNTLTIKEAVIRGEKSPGMLNSLRELGLSQDHGGIFILPEETPLGSKLADHIPSDTILEADILPDRAHDCLSHLGIAREIAAITGLSVQEPALSKLPPAKDEVEGFSLSVEDANSAPRYMGVVINNIQPTQTPLFMQIRLLAMDMRPIHPLVDMSNYVMFEVGNPSHAFDQAKLPGKNIGVRPGKSKEKMQLLDGKTREVPKKALVITANDTPVAAAGVMGGADTEVGESTKDIFLEIATFNAYAIQEAARSMGVRTEASARFSKQISPDLVSLAARRLTHLISNHAGASVQGVLDTHPQSVEPWTVSFRPKRAEEYAGIAISAERAKEILLRLRCAVDDSDSKVWRVTVSADRLDLQGEHDLIDEVVRMHSLQVITSNTEAVNGTPKPLGKEVFIRRRIQNILLDRGFTETYNYSFEPKRAASLLGISNEPYVRIQNPIAPELSRLRRSLVPGLIENMIKNKDYVHRKRARQERALFEIGHVYYRGEGGQVPGIVEKEYVGGILPGDVAAARQTIDVILDAFEVQGVEAKPCNSSKALTSNSLQLTVEGKFLGAIYEFSKPLLGSVKYRMPLVAFEINMDELYRHAADEDASVVSLEDMESQKGAPAQYVELPKYPSVFRDISLLVDPGITVEQAQEVIERTGGRLVADVDLFDEYDPGEGKAKGLAFHVEYRADDRTLTDNEVNEAHGRIILALEQELSAEIR